MKRKWLYSLLLVACFVMSMLVFPVSAATASGTYGNNLTWTFDSDTGTITFSGTGVLTALPENSTDGYMKYCGDIRHIMVAEGITEVAPSSFPWSVFWNVESIWIADSVEKIDRYAFANHFDLKQLRLGKNLKVIGEAAFMSCEELESLILPAGLQSIGVEAFSLCGITELIIPQGVSVIENGAFRGSKNLTRVSIPTSVTEIKYGAFRNCEKLTDVYYTGTKTQWEAITIDNTVDGKGGSNSYLLDATIHYDHTHSVTKEQVTVVATCDKEGEKICSCECGALAETRTIPKSSQHTWDSGTQNGDTTVNYRCTLCNTVKTEGTPATTPASTEPASTEPASTEPASTEPASTEPASTEPASTESISTEPTPAEPEKKDADGETAVSTEPTEGVITIGPSDVTPEQPKGFPWVVVCVGAAVLLAGGGVGIWLWIRKRP